MTTNAVPECTITTLIGFSEKATVGLAKLIVGATNTSDRQDKSKMDVKRGQFSSIKTIE